jgi:acyl-CoA synthetase (AMP-forming)/AMP-acid ligase II
MTKEQVSSSSPKPLRIGDVLKPWVGYSSDRPALVEGDSAWSYGQLANAVSATETWLREAGVRAGDRVMIVGENCRAFVAVLLAANNLDAWSVPVNAHLSTREIDAVRDHCGARRVVYTTGVSLHATEHANHHGARIEEFEGLGTIRIGPLNEQAQPEPLEPDIGSRVAVLIYTSGTTGLPKGVMLTNRNLLFTASGSAKIRSLVPDDHVYGVLPLSHIVGLSVVLLGTLLSGATLYLAPRFDPMAARVALDKDRITIMLGVPSMFSQFLHYAKIRKIESLNLPALRIISCSGAPLPPAVKSEVQTLFGMALHHGYGITECSPSVAQVRVEAPPRKDTSVGPVFPGVEVKLVGPDRKPVPAGEVGQLWVRGPNVMKGYYRAPKETDAVLDQEGWFNAQDLARFEGEDLFIVGREKELIIRFGFNVYPAEVEGVLNGHPAVAKSAVVGRTIDGDEEVIAFVQPFPDSTLTIPDLAQYAARNLAAYKRPSQIVVLPELPVTALGKIVKPELRKIAAELPRRNHPRPTAEPRSASDPRSQNLPAVPSQIPPAK